MRIPALITALAMGSSVAASPLDEYWEHLSSLCGKAFAGSA